MNGSIIIGILSVILSVDGNISGIMEMVEKGERKGWRGWVAQQLMSYLSLFNWDPLRGIQYNIAVCLFCFDEEQCEIRGKSG